MSSNAWEEASIEAIDGAGGILAYIVRASTSAEETTFITPNESTMQAGFVVYPAGGEVPRHEHKPIPRSIIGTSEVILVRQGTCTVELYDERRRLVAARQLEVGDLIVLLGGGHGFKMLEDTVLLEVKQGPYTGLVEKERF